MTLGDRGGRGGHAGGNRRVRARADNAADGAGGSSASRAAIQRGAPAWGARWLLLVLVSVGTLQVLFMLGVEGYRFYRAQQEITRLEAEVAALEAEAAALRDVIEHGTDVRYREALARRQGYMFPSEVRVVTDDVPPAAAGSWEAEE